MRLWRQRWCAACLVQSGRPSRRGALHPLTSPGRQRMGCLVRWNYPVWASHRGLPSNWTFRCPRVSLGHLSEVWLDIHIQWYTWKLRSLSLRILDAWVLVSSSISSLKRPIDFEQQSISFQRLVWFQTQSDPPSTPDPRPTKFGCLRFRSSFGICWHESSFPFRPLHLLVPRCDSAVASCTHSSAVVGSYWYQ